MNAETYIEILNELSELQSKIVKKFEQENPGFTLNTIIDFDCSIKWEKNSLNRDENDYKYTSGFIGR